jgi:uncharacterized protein YycO
MKVLVARNNRPGSWLIRLVTMGKWSHAALLLPNWLVIDTTLTTGVRASPVMAWIRDYPTHEVIDVDLPDEEKAINFARAQLSKPYDWTAIFGMLLQRNWQDQDSWFCSELVEAALSAGGRKRFRDDVSRITPHQTWAVM